MSNRLSRSEERVIEELLTWDDSRRPSEWTLCNVALVIAGCLIVGSAILTLLRLEDDVVIGILVPGFLLGLFLVGVYVFGSKRIRERHQLATIIKKMKEPL